MMVGIRHLVFFNAGVRHSNYPAKVFSSWSLLINWTFFIGQKETTNLFLYDSSTILKTVDLLVFLE